MDVAGVLLRRLALVAGVILVAGVLAGSRPAAAWEIGPVGDPYVVSVSPAVQRGVLSGAEMTPAGLVCAYLTRGVCVVTQAIAMVALPVVVQKGACPGDGVRKLEMQGYQSEGNYGWPSAIVPVYYAKVLRDWCAPT